MFNGGSLVLKDADTIAILAAWMLWNTYEVVQQHWMSAFVTSFVSLGTFGVYY